MRSHKRTGRFIAERWGCRHAPRCPDVIRIRGNGEWTGEVEQVGSLVERVDGMKRPEDAGGIPACAVEGVIGRRCGRGSAEARG